MRLYYVNEVAIKFPSNSKNLSTYKHIKIQLLVMKERIKYQLVSINYTGTNYMLVNPLMKSLPLVSIVDISITLGWIVL